MIVFQPERYAAIVAQVFDWWRNRTAIKSNPDGASHIRAADAGTLPETLPGKWPSSTGLLSRRVV